MITDEIIHSLTLDYYIYSYTSLLVWGTTYVLPFCKTKPEQILM